MVARKRTRLFGVASVIATSVALFAFAIVPTFKPAHALGQVYTVTNTGDNGGVNPAVGGGTGTLRQAIVDANANATLLNGEPHNIQFNIPGTGVQTIALSAGLPAVTRPTIIDGISQPGSSCGTLVPNDGNGKITQSGQAPHLIQIAITGGGLTFNNTATGSVIRGMALALASSVNMNAPNALVECNYFGSDTSGVPKGVNRPLTVSATSDTTEVRNNLFASAINWWVGLQGSSTDSLSGVNFHNNLIGTSPDGLTATNAALEAQTSGLAVGYTTNLAVKNNVFAGIVASTVSWCARINTSQNPTIQGNYFGWSINGTQNLGNCRSLSMDTDSGGLVGGTADATRNYFSSASLSLISGTNVSAKGNYFTLAPDGTTIEQNSTNTAVSVSGGSGVQIGGSGVGEGNVIASKGARGIDISSGSMNFNIQGNYVGVTSDGRPLSMGSIGISVGDAAGTVDGNVVSNQSGTGINITPQKGIVLRRNIIGLAPDGVTPLPNTGNGIGISAGNAATGSVMIGGSGAGDANIIASNGRYGINTYFAVVPITIYGNKIGVAKDGSLKGNGWDGIRFNDGSPGHGTPSGTTIVGGIGAGEGNEIAGNGRSGVFQSYDGNPSSYAVGATIRGNSIHDNAWPGILLGHDSTSLLANDYQDADAGPNNLQNYPNINVTMQRCDGTTAGPVSRLNSTPNTTFTIDYYSNPNFNPASGKLVEGEKWVSSETVTTDANGDASLTLPSGLVNPSATATAPDGSTSEFGGSSVMKFDQCQPMTSGTNNTSKLTYLGGNWTASGIGYSSYQNWSVYDPATGTWKQEPKKSGLEMSIMVDGKPFTADPTDSTIPGYYVVSEGSWYAGGYITTDLPEGKYDVTITITDPVTRLSMTYTYVKGLTVDKTRPTLTYTTPFVYTNNQLPTLTYTASEPISWDYDMVICDATKHVTLQQVYDYEWAGTIPDPGCRWVDAYPHHDAATNTDDYTHMETTANSYMQWLQDPVTGNWSQQAVPLPEGAYDVFMYGADVGGNYTGDYTEYYDSVNSKWVRSGNLFIKADKQLVVDLTAPTGTLNQTTAKPLVTPGNSPELTGTVNDPMAAIDVTLTLPNVSDPTKSMTVGPFRATNNGDGTWVLPAGTIQPGLVVGAYDVTAVFTDPATNTTSTTQTQAVTIEKAIIPIVNPIQNPSSMPIITGTYDPATSEGLKIQIAGVWYIFGTSSQLSVDKTAGTWKLDLSQLASPIQPGTYNVVVQSLVAGNQVLGDTTTNELVIPKPLLQSLAETGADIYLVGAVGVVVVFASIITMAARKYRKKGVHYVRN